MAMVGFIPHILFHPWHPVAKWIPGTKCHQAEAIKNKAWKNVDAVIADEIDRLLQEHNGEVPVQPNRKPGCALASLLKKEPKMRALSKDRLAAEMRPLVLAGFVTTAHAIAFAVGLLAEYPDVATQIAREGKKAGLCSCTDWSCLDLRQVLDQCPTSLYFFQESLRLFPPIHQTGGECLQDCIVTDSSNNNKKYGLRQGTRIIFFNTTMQRQISNGDVLDTQRWDNNNNNNNNNNSSTSNGGKTTTTPLPFLNTFQTGPHVCAGKSLALLEGQVAVLMAATHYILEFADEETKVVELDPSSCMFNIPKDGTYAPQGSKTSPAGVKE